MKKTNNLYIYGMFTLVAFGLSACSNAPAKPAQSEVKTTTEKPAEPVKKTAFVTNAPQGCPKETKLRVKSKEVGDVTFDADHSWYTKWSDHNGALNFVNFDGFDPKNAYGHDIKGNDVKVSWELNTKDKSPLKAGAWNYRNKEENNSLDWLNISTEKLAGGVFDDKGKVEITYLGNDYVCGKVTATDSSSSLNGEFIAKFADASF